MQKIKKKKRIGFVASGGAAKAACFHTGVALALERKGFKFRGGLKKDATPLAYNGREIEVCVGSSAGAFIGALLLSGHKIEDIYEAFRHGLNQKDFRRISYLEMLNPNWLDTLMNSLLRLPKSLAIRGAGSLESLLQGLICYNGYCTTQKLETYIRREVLPSNDFQDLASELYLVTTLLDNPGRAIFGPKKLNAPPQTYYYTDVEISQAAAASMALPPIYKPQPIQAEGQTFYCFDGEIRQTLSTHVAKDAGCDLIIASYTHQPYCYKEEIGSLVDYGIPSILQQTVYQMIESRIMKSKQLHDMKKLVLDTVLEFFDDYLLPKELKDKITVKLEEKMEYNRHLDYIFIHPSPHEELLFFEDHFSLSPKTMAKIAEQGFKSAIRVLKDYDFTFMDPPEAQVVGF